MTTTFTSGRASGALPVFGHMWRMVRDPLGFLTSLPPHGDVVEVRIGSQPMHVVCHPELVRDLLARHDVFDKGGPMYERFRQVVGNGLGPCPHRDHRRQRRLVQPAFHRDRLRGYTGVMNHQVAEVTGRWHDGEVIDVGRAMHAIVARAVTATLFSADLSDAVAAKVNRCIDVLMRSAYLGSSMPSWLVDPLLDPFYVRKRAWLQTVLGEVVDQRRKDGLAREDLLSMLLDARDENDDRLTDDEIFDQISTLLIAGTDTTAGALSWAWHLLGSHPDIEIRLHAEVQTVLAGRALADWGDLPRLVTARKIILETLRLYPPIWLLTRVVNEDTRLGGITIPSGAAVAFSPYLLSRHDVFYPDPQRFDPDRWEDSITTARIPHMPFGWGARKCIGDVFSLTEATLALSSIAAGWRLHPLPGTVRPVPRIVLTPRRLRMRISQRGPTRQ